MDGRKRLEEYLRGQLLEKDREELVDIILDPSGRLEKIEAKLGLESDDSHRPPSSDPPAKQKTRAQRRQEVRAHRKSGRKKGGQPGHEGKNRKFVPVEQVDALVPVSRPSAATARGR